MSIATSFRVTISLQKDHTNLVPFARADITQIKQKIINDMDSFCRPAQVYETEKEKGTWKQQFILAFDNRKARYVSTREFFEKMQTKGYRMTNWSELRTLCTVMVQGIHPETKRQIQNSQHPSLWTYGSNDRKYKTNSTKMIASPQLAFIQFATRIEAEHAEDYGITINDRNYSCQLGYNIYVNKCYNCLALNDHTNVTCKNPPRCSNCGHNHDYRRCTKQKMKFCCNCNAHGHGPLSNECKCYIRIVEAKKRDITATRNRKIASNNIRDKAIKAAAIKTNTKSDVTASTSSTSKQNNPSTKIDRGGKLNKSNRNIGLVNKPKSNNINNTNNTNNIKQTIKNTPASKKKT